MSAGEGVGVRTLMVGFVLGLGACSSGTDDGPAVETETAAQDACSPMPVHGGPYASDAAAWERRWAAPRSHWDGENGSVEDFTLTGVQSERAVYTGDGRLLLDSSAAVHSESAFAWEYQPGSWKIATAKVGRSLETAIDRVYTWDGNTAKWRQTRASGGRETGRVEHRPDGLPVYIEPDTSAYKATYYTYVNAESWQLSRVERGGAFGFAEREDYAWDCLTATITRDKSDQVREVTYTRRGRPLLERVDLDGDGVFESERRWTYPFGDWRPGRLTTTVLELGASWEQPYEWEAAP